ncbi:glycerophosphodiester phosphodiesterase family protein [Phenylobacterium sp.]|uniref:glycerophosphodiester phosphodiesterase family protein n=1 Tax=Phenylobacterium sp. TaxID=1871053 RepID=UPI0037841B74
MRARFGEAWDRLFHPPIAHRGLWALGGAPENSLAAFQAACVHGYGIELDVQLSSDGEAMVFHDEELARLTGATGRLSDHTAAQLSGLRLAGTDETMPTLAEALAVIGHRAMALIELKTPAGQVGPLEQRVHDTIIDHAGPVAVIGFNPYSHAWFAERFPGVLRGLNSYSYRDAAKISPDLRRSYARFEHLETARPHFLAPGLDILETEPVAALRAKGIPVIAWTARSAEQGAAIAAACDNLIFEGYPA